MHDPHSERMSGGETRAASGLALVFRENVVRFFDPFDHMGPIYTYLIYLPAYTLPWAPCWLLGLWLALRQWPRIEPNTRWLIWSLGLLFAFFTASGSRRSYYVLPLVPFAQLLAAWWVTRHMAEKRAAGKPSGPGWAKGFAGAAALVLLIIGVVYPWSNSGGGVMRFADDVQARAPWDEWQMVMIEVDNKLPMYLNNQGTPFYYVQENQDYPRNGNSDDLIDWLEKTSGRRWDPTRTLIITSFKAGDALPLDYLAADHDTVVTQPTNGARLTHNREDGSVAYIPRRDGPLEPTESRP